MITRHIVTMRQISPLYFIHMELDSTLTVLSMLIANEKNIDPVEFYNRLVSRALLDITARVNLYFYAGGSGQRFANTNLILSSDSLMAFFFSKLKGEILKMNDSAERNFHLAYILKNEANFFAFRKEARGLDNKEYDALYRESINYYQQVSRESLSTNLK